VLQSLGYSGWVQRLPPPPLPTDNIRLKASGIPLEPQQKGKTSCDRAGAVPGAPSQHYLLSSLITAGRTSSPRRRKMTRGVVHAHHQRVDNSASPSGAQAKSFEGPWARALPLFRTQQRSRNSIQGWDNHIVLPLCKHTVLF